MEMSKEVLSAVSQSYELATYSTPELRGPFNDWVQAIEGEIIGLLKDRGKVDSDEVAANFKLTKESAIFVLGKMEKEGKITMQAFQRRKQ